VKFPFVFKQKETKKKHKTRRLPYFFMTNETNNNPSVLPDLTDIEEVRKAVIAGEVLNRKY
jgi:hypothetical protein